jgi:hypothetical protein
VSRGGEGGGGLQAIQMSRGGAHGKVGRVVLKVLAKFGWSCRQCALHCYLLSSLMLHRGA